MCPWSCIWLHTLCPVATEPSGRRTEHRLVGIFSRPYSSDMYWPVICELCMNVCTPQAFHRPGHQSWRRVSVLSPEPYSNWNHQSWHSRTCRRCKTKQSFNIHFIPNRKTVNVRFCSAEAMQIYSKLRQLLSEWAVSGQPVSVKITRTEKKKKAEVRPLISLKKEKANFHKWNWMFPWCTILSTRSWFQRNYEKVSATCETRSSFKAWATPPPRSSP